MRAIKLRILKTSQRIHQLQSHIYARKNLRYSHKKVIDDDEDLKSKGKRLQDCSPSYDQSSDSNHLALTYNLRTFFISIITN